MHPDVAAAIKEIREDRAHGASFLAQRAIETLAMAARLSEARTPPGLIEDVREAAEALVKARPTMVSIANSTARYFSALKGKAVSARGTGELGDLAQEEAAHLIRESREAAQRIAEHARAILSPDDAVVTCSYSSTVCDVLVACHPRRVLAVESRSGGVAYGELTAQRLRQAGLNAEVVADSEMRRRVAEATKAVMGADSILSDGSIVNGAPSLEMALACQERGIPLYVVSETSKFAPGEHVEEEMEPGFDRVPAALVTAIVTEEGLLDPSHAGSIATRNRNYYVAFN